MIKREEGVAVATWLSIAAAMGADFSIPRRAVPERDKRTPDDAAERMAAAEAKRQRKAAKRLRLVPEADSGVIVGKWMPIETAPKDGARIMLANAHGVWIADWRPVYQSGYRPDDPWASAMLNLDHIPMDVRYVRATHWQPLPPPPEAA